VYVPTKGKDAHVILSASQVSALDARKTTRIKTAIADWEDHNNITLHLTQPKSNLNQ
jgi:hypothetical protein